ncbi:hypothetical protein BYT27DRAFT_7315599 [Phlegmacium glaucopus]|nr:hypothetical protein BYT27DRAFT_7315599 [Phlegmacium glaucopus]
MDDYRQPFDRRTSSPRPLAATNFPSKKCLLDVPVPVRMNALGHPKDELNYQMYIDSLSGEQRETYYDDVNSASILATNNTAYKWSFASKEYSADNNALRNAREEVGAAIYGQELPSIVSHVRITTPLENSVKSIGAAIDNNLWFLFLRLQESVEDWRLGGVGSVASVEEVKGVTSVVVKNSVSLGFISSTVTANWVGIEMMAVR